MTYRGFRRFALGVGLSVLPLMASSAPLTSTDTNGDGKISRSEAMAAQDRSFKRLDTNGDGTLSRKEFDAGQPGLPDDASADDRKRRKAIIGRWFDHIDTDHDDKIGDAEYRKALSPYFDQLDENHDGMLSAKEIHDSLGSADSAQAKPAAPNGK